MQTGAITGSIDVAQLALYAVWLFLAGLIYYLRREDKREGYPLVHDRPSMRGIVQGFPAVPPPKTFLLPHGGMQYAPRPDPQMKVQATPIGGWPGAPLEPVGDPMLARVGPGAYASRSDVADAMHDGGAPKIVPLRVATDFSIDAEDVDPRGMKLVSADRVPVGVVSDAWVDRSEYVLRYLEVSLEPTEAGEAATVLVPMHFAQINSTRRVISVHALMARHFRDVPRTAHAESISLLEEDRIVAYFAAGLLYASPSRSGPWL